MTVVNMLRQEMPISRISMAMDVHRSFIYYNRKEHERKRKQRISAWIVSEILRISLERSTYGYRRIWAMLRNSGTRVNVKTVRRIMRMNSLSLPYARHKSRKRKKYLTKPDDINKLWETDIHYIGTVRGGTEYLMSIKDCFSKKWISYELSRTCTAKDAIRAGRKIPGQPFPCYIVIQASLMNSPLDRYMNGLLCITRNAGINTRGAI